MFDNELRAVATPGVIITWIILHIVCIEFLNGKRSLYGRCSPIPDYGDVVERMLMRSQPIQGVRDSLKGKGGLFIFLSVCCLSDAVTPRIYDTICKVFTLFTQSFDTNRVLQNRTSF